MSALALALGRRVGKGLRGLRARLRGRSPSIPMSDYWANRAERLGARAVVHMGHAEDAFAAVTLDQKRLLLPLFHERLTDSGNLILDLGCGPGRFTSGLTRSSADRAIGLDPTARLLTVAPRDDRVDYVRAYGDRIPAASGAFDAIWVCLVLGGIVCDDQLDATASEIMRVLRPGGLLFLVENTSDQADGDHWHYRSEDFYRALFEPIPFVHLTDYDDLGERNSVLCGRIDE